MSGGSFNYAYLTVDDSSEMFTKLDEVCSIEEWLRANGHHLAADEVLIYIKEMETHQRRLEVIGRRIAPLLRAVEWEASGDGADIEAEYWALMGLTPPASPAG